MRAIPEIEVDLALPPAERWSGLRPWRTSGRALLEFYLRDLGIDLVRPLLASYRDEHVGVEYAAEMAGIARIFEVDFEHVLAVNLYYDAMKFVLGLGQIGCSGFVASAAGGPLHARNLDWTTAHGLLASESIICNFVRGSGPVLYRTVGWPGFIGCFSGVAPGRFAVSLNAVFSEDRPEFASPIVLVLRRALETMDGFEQALAYLRAVPVASDGLLLLSGAREDEMAVIERAPKRAAVRRGTGGRVLVTNDYRALKGATGGGESDLVVTSCSRYDRVEALLSEAMPADADGCLGVLSDAGVRMPITAQQMVFRASTGEISLRRGNE